MKRFFNQLLIPWERADSFNNDSKGSKFSKQLHFFRYTTVRKHAQGKLLDVGCGTGNLKGIIGEEAQYYGIDPSQEAIRAATNLYSSNSRFTSYDGNKIPFQNDYFDITSSLEVIEHLRKEFHNNHIEEIKRVTKPGGLIVISTPNRNYLYKNLKEFLFNFNNPFHKYEYKTNEFINLLKEHSLDIVEIKYIGDPLNIFGNLITQSLFFSNKTIRNYLFKCGLFFAKSFKSICNDILVICKNSQSLST